VLTMGQYGALLARLNGVTGRGDTEITLLPGMAFLAREKWWVRGEERRRPHEGVDLVCWTDDSGQRHFFGAGIRVPCLISGEIVAICTDFLGKSVFVRGADTSRDGLVAVHAHIMPQVRLGDQVVLGEEVGSIAEAHGPVPAHLHLSLLRCNPAWPWAAMDWQFLNGCDLQLFLNPFA